MDRAAWERTAALFERALDVHADEREAFVRAEANGDGSLAEAVLRMLRHDSGGQLLDRSLEAVAGSLIDAPGDEDAPELVAGDRVGDYEIVDVLGRGGMGVVYRARDTRLGRLAALKFLPTPDPAAAATSRMEAEARAASALDHPNIATIYHVGAAADGRPFIAMAHYDGETLARRLERGALDPPEALRIAAAIAAGLAAAHERGIVHRDVKPSNVLLTTGGGVKLLDFGIAAVAGDSLAGSASGTRLYMSPEQARSASPHTSSDVWSLGTVLHEMLTGRPPAGTADASPRAGSPPDAGAAGDRAGGRPRIPPAIDAIVQRALAPAPSARYPDAGSMYADLECVRAVVAPPAGRKGRRGVAARAFGGAVLACGAAAVMFAARSRAERRATPSRSVVAVFPFEVRGDSALGYLREGMVDLLSADFDGVGGLTSVDPRAIRAGIAAAPAAVHDPREAAALATKLGAGRFMLGTIVAGGGRIRAAASLYDYRGRLETSAQAEVAGEGRIFDVVDRLAGRLLTQQDASGGEMRLLAASTTASLPALKAYLEGEQAFRSGHFEAASSAFERAVALDTSFALADYGLASAEWWAEHSDRARDAAARALRHADRLPRAARLALDGWLARFDGDLERAERIYRQLTAIAPNDVDGWFGLADVLHHYNPVRGRPLDDAVPFFERALALQPDNMSVRLHLANIAARHRQYARHDSLVASLPPAGRYGRFVRLVRAFAGSDTAAQDRVALEFRGADDRTIGEALHYIVRLAHNPAGGLRFLELVDRPGRDRRSAASLRFLRAGIQLTLGRWNAAREELETADSLGLPAALPTLALWSLAPFVPPDTARWRAWRVRLDRRERAEAPSRPDAGDRETLAVLRGLLAVRLGDTASASRLADRLDAAARANGASASGGAQSIRAELALGRGDSAGALALLAGARAHPSIDPLQDPASGDAYARFLRAELLAAAGRGAEALAWYRGQQESSTLEAVYLAPSYLRSARLLAARGDPAAADLERRFRELWSSADSAAAAWSATAPPMTGGGGRGSAGRSGG